MKLGTKLLWLPNNTFHELIHITQKPRLNQPLHTEIVLPLLREIAGPERVATAEAMSLNAIDVGKVRIVLRRPDNMKHGSFQKTFTLDDIPTLRNYAWLTWPGI